MERIYLSKLVGDGLTEETAFMAAWREIIGHKRAHGATGQGTTDHGFWIGVIDTDTPQHDALIADGRVRYVPQAILGTEYQNLTQGHKDEIMEVVNWLGYDPSIFNTNVKVKDILFYLIGKCQWFAIQNMGIET